MAAPQSNPSNGIRLIPQRGMIQPGLSGNAYTLSLPAGTYYWSVQAIDTGFAGSDWAIQQSFTL